METSGMVGNSYYQDTSFINVYYSTILSVFSHLGAYLFPNDPSRVIYSSNDHAFRRRLRLNSRDDISQFQINSLNLPFLNFAISSSGISSNTNRPWKSYPLELNGIMDWTLNKKFRLSPVNISFEATYLSDKEIDIQYAFSKITWDNALETILKPQLEIEGESFNNIGILSYDINYRPQYNENDWFEKNKIRTISLNFSIDTFLIETTTEGFWIPQEVLFSFASAQDLEIHDWDDYDELLTGVISHIEETVTF